MAWAAALMCRYSRTYCDEAEKWFDSSMATSNLRYSVGYDVRTAATALLCSALRGWLPCLDAHAVAAFIRPVC